MKPITHISEASLGFQTTTTAPNKSPKSKQNSNYKVKRDNHFKDRYREYVKINKCYQVNDSFYNTGSTDVSSVF